MVSLVMVLQVVVSPAVIFLVVVSLVVVSLGMVSLVTYFFSISRLYLESVKEPHFLVGAPKLYFLV